MVATSLATATNCHCYSEHPIADRECGKINETSEELVWLDHYDNQVRHLDLETFILAINEAIILGQCNIPFLIWPISSMVGREELCTSTFSPINVNCRPSSAGCVARYALQLPVFSCSFVFLSLSTC